MSIILDGTNGITSVTGSASLTAAGPAFSAYNSSSITLTAGTYTKVAFQTKVFDTNTNFDNTTNYRFTPTIAGYYQINASVSTNNPAGAVTASIYKTGSIYAKGSINVPQAATTLAASFVSSIVYLNGSTDYVEIYALQTNGSSQTTNANSYDTYFNGCLIRSA